MSERREFVKVERMGVKARYSVEIPITTETVHACIIEVWGMTNAERVAVGVKPMRGWEDE